MVNPSRSGLDPCLSGGTQNARSSQSLKMCDYLAIKILQAVDYPGRQVQSPGESDNVHNTAARPAFLVVT